MSKLINDTKKIDDIINQFIIINNLATNEKNKLYQQIKDIINEIPKDSIIKISLDKNKLNFEIETLHNNKLNLQNEIINKQINNKINFFNYSTYIYELITCYISLIFLIIILLVKINKNND